MVYLHLAGVLLSAVLLSYRINILVRHVQGIDVGNVLSPFQCFIGWPAGVLLGAIGILLLWVYEIPGDYLQLADLILTLAILAAIDLKWRIIPNLIVLALLVSQLVAAFTYAEAVSLWNILFAAIQFFVLAFASKLSKEQIGMGDVKLLSVVSLIYGFSFLVYSTILSMLLMLLMMIPLLVLKKLKLKSEVPFAPFYFLGTTAYVILTFVF